MIFVKKYLRVTISILFVISCLSLNAKPYPLEYFALREVVDNVQVSPDGKLLALLANRTKEGNPVLEIYNASDLSKKPFRLNAKPMEITGFDWVSNSNIVLRLRQKVRDEIEGFNEGVYDRRIASFDYDKKKIKNFNEVNPFIENLLPNKKNKILISFQPKRIGKSKLDPRFRPRSYYEFDLKRGIKKLLIKGNNSLGRVVFNQDGDPIIARGFDRSKADYLWYFREPGADDWEEIFRLSEDSFESFTINGKDTKPNTLLVTAHNGNDKAGLWEFDYKKKSFGEVIYLRGDVNVAGVRSHSNKWKHKDDVVAVAYRTDKTHFEYFDPVEEATYEQLGNLISNAHDLRITSRARDEQTMVISNIGPRDPGSFYLLKDGKLQTVGKKQSLLQAEELADVKYIKYKARDGKKIRGFITIPNGEGPFPLIVMPHGGPFVAETVVFDEWAQMLANNGYMVLQPSYRGSTQYGLDFYKSAFINGGQGGYQMQDDKDDGVAYLVKKGLVDPDRVAMYGWSYGGYAALIAASRTPQLYQCVIAGAAVSDTLMQVNYYRNKMRGASEIEQLSMWMDSISPIKEVAKVNVPILLIHGSVDQRVPIEHAKIYLEELDKHNKSYKYVELDGADHFSNTLFFRHQIMLYESIINYLRNDCGPSGL